MRPAIHAENLGKRYRLGQTHAGSVREAVGRALAHIRGRARPAPALSTPPDGRPLDPNGGFWALKDVSFEVQSGEVVGIIGRNGSGKSTLLKILSRITAPTRGRVEINGRVASLLEVGTGFHPELSGQENVYLNGAILGMARAEVRRKLDDIVAFAEIEQFIDTPVKRYSSGMYVRLAFAVAAHLDPDILIIDEVLAVGDLKFQKKCLSKMSSVATKGITVLLVTHNLEVANRVASRMLLLDRGHLVAVGTPGDVCNRYNESFFEVDDISGQNLKDRLSRTNGKVRFASVRILDAAGVPTFALRRDQDIWFEIALVRTAPIDAVVILLYLISPNKVTVASFRILLDEEPHWDNRSFRFRVDANQIKSGEYQLYLALGNKELESFYDVIDINVGLPPLVILPPRDLTRDDVAYVNLRGILA